MLLNLKNTTKDDSIVIFLPKPEIPASHQYNLVFKHHVFPFVDKLFFSMI